MIDYKILLKSTLLGVALATSVGIIVYRIIPEKKLATFLTKEGAANSFYTEEFDHLNRLVLIQKSLNDIEKRLTRIEERLDK